jgi:glycine hydroxymethyltransferase
MKDIKIQTLLKKEEKRQKEGIELIPSENYASTAVRSLLSTCFVNKYSEGYPHKRHYGGNEVVDEVELLAQERAKKLFGVPFANIQPYSGSPANLAVYLATCNPGDHTMGQSLNSGGHLTHGHKVTASGTYYNPVQYGVRSTPKNGDLFDYDEIRKLARQHKPKLIWVGASAYPLTIHYEKFAQIADEVGAYLAADIAHIAGLVAGGAHPSPVPYVHIITTTTHKTLRGPRGAMIMVTEKGLKKDPDLGKKINRAVFPGIQGGPHDNQTAAIAVALFEAAQPSFKSYAHEVVKNTGILAEELKKNGFTLVGNGTQNHLILVDLTQKYGSGFGVFAQKALDVAGLTLNANTVPDEKSSAFFPSGIRLGAPAATTRGMKEKEMKFIVKTLVSVLEVIKNYSLPPKEKRAEYISVFEKAIEKNAELKKLRLEVKKMAVKFAIP